MRRQPVPFVRDLVLLGAGHANVQVLRYYGMNPQPGIRVTVIAREPHSPYSGMLPGYVYGRYSWEKIHVDLAKLCAYADARFIADEAIRVHPNDSTISFRTRPDVHFDCLAINTGGEPGIKYRSLTHVTPVKPIGKFTKSWQTTLEKLDTTQTRNLTIVGGGPGSVEVALAVRERHPQAFAINLVSADPMLLSQHNRCVRRKVEKELRANKVEYRVNFEVDNINESYVYSKDGEAIPTDLVLWVAGVEAPSWIRESGFDVDAHGFLRVDKKLCTLSHSNVFAAGDIVCLEGQERPKSGVYAVRSGPILSQNTHRMLTQRRLLNYNAQRRALAILRLPNDQALASKGALCLKSKLISVWKHWIDVRFMDRFVRFPRKKPMWFTRNRFPESKTLQTNMRCGGCGSKLGASLLDRTLRRLMTSSDQSAICGIGDDAAIVDVTSDSIVTSCDQFRSMITDPYRFGRIAANHALNDLYAMGSEPNIALAFVTIPLMASKLMEEDLYHTLAGALNTFAPVGVQLVGGHSAEGLELTLGFAVTGTTPQQPFLKSNLAVAHDLILTKPLGTGVLLAGSMQGKTKAMDLVNCIDVMEQSNFSAVKVFSKHNVSAVTDVTGFGLLGHLAEMMQQSTVHCEVHYSSIPILPGVRELISDNVHSTLHESNLKFLESYQVKAPLLNDKLTPLVDPQTCGGLLAAVPKSNSTQCLDDLRQAGFDDAAIIGQTISGDSSIVVSRS